VTLRLVVIAAVLAASIVVLATLTASNTVPATSAGQQQAAIDANALKPAACNWNLTTVVLNGNGTAGNDLILATGVATTLIGNGGQDCMIGGAGNDTFKGNGNKAGDVCIGNGGNDINSANKCQNFTQ
jgi:Ca2+-binding RTX toxin-like protein